MGAVMMRAQQHNTPTAHLLCKEPLNRVARTLSLPLSMHPGPNMPNSRPSRPPGKCKSARPRAPPPPLPSRRCQSLGVAGRRRL